MAQVVLLKGVNVGGHRVFRPSALAKSLGRFDIVNIGVALEHHPGRRADAAPRGLNALPCRRAVPGLCCGVLPAAVFGLLAALVGCGGQGPAPTSPTPTAPAPASASVTSVSVSGTAPAIGMTSPFTATAGLSDGTTRDVTTQAAWASSNSNVVIVSASGLVTGVGIGEAEVSASYQGTRGVQRVALAGSALTSFQKDYIEAVFLGTGRLTPTDGNHGCSATGFMRGFPRNTSVSVIVSTSVSSDKLAAIRRVADQVVDATGGMIRTVLTTTDDLDPRPGRNQVTSTARPDAGTQGCPSDNGCTIHVFVTPSAPGAFVSSRAVQPPSQTAAAFAHDVIGHGVLGLCHPDGNLIGGPRLSLMSAGPGVFSGDLGDRLTSFDLLATRAVYGAGLDAGARRSDFVRAGLINP